MAEPCLLGGLDFQGSVENPGINQRALKHLFNEIEERKDMWSYTVNVSSVEIYNELLR
jgi:kinesin family protein C2/C3